MLEKLKQIPKKDNLEPIKIPEIKDIADDELLEIQKQEELQKQKELEEKQKQEKEELEKMKLKIKFIQYIGSLEPFEMKTKDIIEEAKKYNLNPEDKDIKLAIELYKKKLLLKVDDYVV